MSDYLAKIAKFQKSLLEGRGTRPNPKPKSKKYMPKEKYSSVELEKPNPMLENVRMEYIEKIIEVIPPREKLTISTLKQYLKSLAEQTKLSDIERAYLVYYWVSHNIDYDFNSFSKNKAIDCSPDSVLKTGQTVCGGYSSLYRDLVTNLGIECVDIDCFAKGFGFQIGEAIPNKTNHEHNAIKLNNKWYLVDSTWGAGAIVDNKYQKDFNNFYFCCDPKEFVLTHYPTDQKWQLLKEPISKEVFSIFPFIDKRFFQFGFKSMNPFACQVNTEQIIDVIFYYDPNLDNNLKMNVQLFFEKKEEKNSCLIQKYDDYFQIRILLNNKGNYIAHFFAINGNDKEVHFKQITELKIVSNKKQDKPLGLPTLKQNYGNLVLETPFCDVLPKGANICFKLYSIDINEITIVNGDEWIDLKKGNDGYFKKDVVVKDKEVKICEKIGGKYFPRFIYKVK